MERGQSHHSKEIDPLISMYKHTITTASVLALFFLSNLLPTQGSLPLAYIRENTVPSKPTFCLAYPVNISLEMNLLALGYEPG